MIKTSKTKLIVCLIMIPVFILLLLSLLLGDNIGIIKRALEGTNNGFAPLYASSDSYGSSGRACAGFGRIDLWF